MTGNSATRLVNVDITGRQTLRLVVTNGGDGFSFDHANWADAQLITGSTPAPVQPPAPPPPTGTLTREWVVSGLNQPIAFDWSPDSRLMFIAEKGGVVKVFVNGVLQATPFIDISAQVNNIGDRGLLELAVDPFFGQNRGRDYVYLLFTYDPPETTGRSGLAGPDGGGNRPARLSNGDRNG